MTGHSTATTARPHSTVAHHVLRPVVRLSSVAAPAGRRLPGGVQDPTRRLAAVDPGPGTDCDAGCHYCSGPETD